MQSILEKIYTGTADEAVSEILETYQQEDFSVVNFVYFANIVSQSLFSDKDKTEFSDKDKTEKEREYKKILLRSDFLLPDGIALQIFYACAKLLKRIDTPRLWLENLNWTDFVPYFLDEAKKKYWPQKLCILLYGTKQEYLDKAEEKIKHKWFNVIYK